MEVVLQGGTCCVNALPVLRNMISVTLTDYSRDFEIAFSRKHIFERNLYDPSLGFQPSFQHKFTNMPRGIFRYFLILCIFLTAGILVSILDRILTFSGYRSYHSLDKSSTYRLENLKDSHVVGIENWLRKATRNVIVRRQNESKQRSQTSSEAYEKENNRRQNITKESAFDVFKQYWCQMQRARLEWREVLGTCFNSTEWEKSNNLHQGINQISDSDKSFISRWDIKQAGEFSRFIIQTVTPNGDAKTIGGDSWRVHLYGASSLAPTVLDHDNGTYEVLFLIIEGGDYEAKIFLDYSLCHGFKDPPPFWFKKGKDVLFFIYNI